MSAKYIVSAGHNHPETLADGRTVAPGQTVEVDAKANARLIEEGILIKLPDEKPAAKSNQKKEDGDNG